MRTDTQGEGEDGTWYVIYGAKTNASAAASDEFALNCGLLLMRSTSGEVGGPYESPCSASTPPLELICIGEGTR